MLTKKASIYVKFQLFRMSSFKIYKILVNEGLGDNCF